MIQRQKILLNHVTCKKLVLAKVIGIRICIISCYTLYYYVRGCRRRSLLWSVAFLQCSFVVNVLSFVISYSSFQFLLHVLNQYEQAVKYWLFYSSSFGDGSCRIVFLKASRATIIVIKDFYSPLVFIPF